MVDIAGPWLHFLHERHLWFLGGWVGGYWSGHRSLFARGFHVVSGDLLLGFHVGSSGVDVERSGAVEGSLGHKEECQDKLEHKCTTHGVHDNSPVTGLHDGAGCPQVRFKRP